MEVAICSYVDGKAPPDYKQWQLQISRVATAPELSTQLQRPYMPTNFVLVCEEYPLQMHIPSFIYTHSQREVRRVSNYSSKFWCGKYGTGICKVV